MASSSKMASSHGETKTSITGLHLHGGRGGSAQHQNTILASAIEVLKSQRAPVRLEDFALTQGLLALIEDATLKERFTSHPRVEYNPRLDLVEWKPEHDLRTPQDLIHLLRERYLSDSSRCAGMTLAKLRESYPKAKEAIEEFANVQPPEDREVLVMRGKDGSAKMVFWNEFQGQQAKGVDQEFRDLWRQTEVPDAVDLARSLEADGLSSANLVTSTASHPSFSIQHRTGGATYGGKQSALIRPGSQYGRGGVARGGARGGPRGGSSRRGRISKLQNTHIAGVDFSKEYHGD